MNIFFDYLLICWIFSKRMQQIVFFHNLFQQLILLMGSLLATNTSSRIHEHPNIGKIDINTTKDKKGNASELMTVVKIVDSKRQFDKWHTNMSKLDYKEAKEIFLLPIDSSFQSSGYCVSNGYVKLTYEHYPYAFSNQIKYRERNRLFFIESQLWYLLYRLVQAGSMFQKQNTKIGDIHPNNILINNNGRMKIICSASSPQQLTNYEKILENPNQDVYLAPQECTEISIVKGIYPKNIDPSICECFSIGLCVLAAGSLELLEGIYVWEKSKFKIQQAKIKHYLGLFQKRYGKYLFQFVAGLLTNDPNQRRRCSQIYQRLYKYQKSILSISSFDLNSENAYRIPYLQSDTVHLHPFTINWYDSAPNYRGFRPLFSLANATNIYYDLDQTKAESPIKRRNPLRKQFSS